MPFSRSFPAIAGESLSNKKCQNSSQTFITFRRNFVRKNPSSFFQKKSFSELLDKNSSIGRIKNLRIAAFKSSFIDFSDFKILVLIRIHSKT